MWCMDVVYVQKKQHFKSETNWFRVHYKIRLIQEYSRVFEQQKGIKGNILRACT